MNRVTGGFLTAALGLGIAIGWFSGAFGPLIATAAAAIRGQAPAAGPSAAAPASSTIPAASSPQLVA